MIQDLGILSNDPQIEKRLFALCSEFKFTFEYWKNLEESSLARSSPKVIVAHLIEKEGPIPPEILGNDLRKHHPDSFLILITRHTQTKEEAQKSELAGCDLVLLEDEIYSTGKLEFLCTQIIRAKFIPIKTSDLVAGRKINFDLFHLLPMRGKFFRFAEEGEILDEKKIEKSQIVGEFYIERRSSMAFKQYVVETADASPMGFEKRGRSQFLHLFSEYIELVYKLTSQSEHASFQEGHFIQFRCLQACSQLIETLGQYQDAWRIINNSSIYDFGSLERAPAVAAYTGLFALKIGMDAIPDMMLMALFSDLGLIFISPKILKKIRDSRTPEFTEEERKEYEGYPLRSLNVILGRKLAVPDLQREWILSSRESWNGMGFPKGLTSNAIPFQARLIAFSRDFDRKSSVKLGQVRPDPLEVLSEMLSPHSNLDSVYGEDLINALRIHFC